ncbi:MAG: hypothetical protein U9R42_01215 [Bacteroidota bacterium]|nr:hypothetical protein [Bacteroidota bacterium]
MNQIKKIVFALFLVLFSLKISAQINLDKFNKGIFSNNQELILKSIDSSFVIFKQEYVLKTNNRKKNITFGLNGKDYFGVSYFFGVLANGFIWVNDEILEPWEKDTNYYKYKNIDTLEAVLSNTFCKSIYDTNYSQIKRYNEIQINDTLIKYNKTLEELSIIRFISIKKKEGLKVNNVSKTKSGWIVFAYFDGDSLTNENIRYAIYKTELNIKRSEAKLEKVPAKENIIGGFFLTLSYSTGCINFYCSGITNKKLLNYYISLIPRKKESNVNVDLEIIKQNNK